MVSLSSNLQAQLKEVDFDPFADGEVLLTVPATESQKEIWASVRMGNDANCAYNESHTLRLKGALNVEVFRSALQELVQRHEALRMTLSPDGATLCINVNQQLVVPLEDLSALDEQERNARLKQLLAAEVNQPFNLEHGPLFRVQIVRLQLDEYWILLTAHHIICDGWSWAVLLPDLGRIYSALVQGETPRLESPDRFSNYALMLAENADSEEACTTESFWREQFSQSIPVLDFPTDHPRPAVRTFAANREDWLLDAALVTNLKQLGSQLGCSFMTTMLSAFEVFLYRLTGQQEVVVGIPAAGQAATGNCSLVGHCVNLLPLRTTINAEQPFSHYLKQRQSKILDAYEHQQFTFGKLVQNLPIPRDPSRIPLVSVLFNIDQALQADKLPFAGLEAEFFSNPRAYENFELFVNAVEHSKGLTLECQYNTNLFEPQTVRTRLAELEQLLVGIVANPNQPIATLPLLTEAEQTQLIRWNQTTTEFPKDLCIHQLVEAQVKRTPNKVAVVFEAEQLTYQELDQRANQLAYYLQELGVQPETTVGICVERSLDMIVGVLGILKAGGAYVPLDPAYPTERLHFLIQDAQVSVLLTQPHLKANLPETNAKIVYLDQDLNHDVATALDLSQPPSSGVSSDDLAYIIYTSGSTGKPKGVQIPHCNVINLLHAVQRQPGLTAEDTLLSVTTLSFDIAVAELFLPLSVGATLVLVSREVAADGQRLLNQLLTTEPTYMQATPATWRLLLAAGWNGSPRLKIISTGEALPKDLANQLLDKGTAVWNLYGPTETTIWSTGYQIQTSDQPITIGYPLLNTQVYVLDAHLQPVPIGVPGELYIGGVGVARGYLNRPELTHEKFIPNPYSSEPHARLYKTGDLARFLPNGQIECLGRIDHQVKIRGFRIELGEVEAALCEHPAVKQAVAIVRAHQSGEKILVGYFTPTSGDQPNRHDDIVTLRRFLKSKLPDFMVPNRLIALETMPLTPNGKIDRKALPDIDVSEQIAGRYVAPQTELEQQIATLWTDVLHIQRVGRHDNFFELGGHSILAIQVIARLRKAMQIELPLTTLFELPTVAEFANYIENIRWAKQGATLSAHLAEAYEEGEL